MCPVACLYHLYSPPFKSDRSRQVHAYREHSQTQKVFRHFLTKSHLGSDQNNFLTQIVSAHFQVSKWILVWFNCSKNTTVMTEPWVLPSARNSQWIETFAKIFWTLQLPKHLLKSCSMKNKSGWKIEVFHSHLDTKKSAKGENAASFNLKGWF